MRERGQATEICRRFMEGCVQEDVYTSVITRRVWRYRLETAFSPHFSHPTNQPIALRGIPFYRNKVTPHTLTHS